MEPSLSALAVSSFTVTSISSHEINKADIFKAKFAWARGYGAFSVSEGQLDSVIKYIKNQEEHHKKINFTRELELFQKKYSETVKTVFV